MILLLLFVLLNDQSTPEDFEFLNDKAKEIVSFLSDDHIRLVQLDPLTGNIKPIILAHLNSAFYGALLYQRHKVERKPEIRADSKDGRPVLSGVVTTDGDIYRMTLTLKYPGSKRNIQTWKGLFHLSPASRVLLSP